jgi:hypothetical protein
MTLAKKVPLEHWQRKIHWNGSATFPNRAGHELCVIDRPAEVEDAEAAKAKIGQ